MTVQTSRGLFSRLKHYTGAGRRRLRFSFLPLPAGRFIRTVSEAERFDREPKGDFGPFGLRSGRSARCHRPVAQVVRAYA